MLNWFKNLFKRKNPLQVFCIEKYIKELARAEYSLTTYMREKHKRDHKVHNGDYKSTKQWYKFPGEQVKDSPYYVMTTEQVVIPIFNIVNGSGDIHKDIADKLLEQLKAKDAYPSNGTLYILQDVTCHIEQKMDKMYFTAFETIGVELD